MTVSMAIRSSLPGLFRDDGYDLPAGLSFEQWLEIGEALQQMERSVKWWLGDWWNYGTRAYGEMASQASKDHVEDATGYAYHTIENAAAVARKFENSRRRENLSWSHHDAVAGLSPTDADALLDRAEADGLNVFAMRDAARGRKQALLGTAVDVAGDVLDSVPLPLTIDDLTDEARAPLNVRLAEMGARMRPGFASGWVQALVWAGQDDAFKRGRS
jgi:hypothetical protein